jgi:hypothetical protein
MSRTSLRASRSRVSLYLTSSMQTHQLRDTREITTYKLDTLSSGPQSQSRQARDLIRPRVDMLPYCIPPLRFPARHVLRQISHPAQRAFPRNVHRAMDHAGLGLHSERTPRCYRPENEVDKRPDPIRSRHESARARKLLAKSQGHRDFAGEYGSYVGFCCETG